MEPYNYHIICFGEAAHYSPELIAGVREYHTKLKQISAMDQLVEELLEPTPKILFLAAASLEQSLNMKRNAYTKLQNRPLCLHKVAVSITAEEAPEAFEKFTQHAVDDFFIRGRPDAHFRALLVAQNLYLQMSLIGVSEDTASRVEERDQKFTEACNQSISNVESSIDNAYDFIKQNAHRLDLNLIKEVLEDISENNIKPELERLSKQSQQIAVMYDDNGVVNPTDEQQDSAEIDALLNDLGENSNGAGLNKKPKVLLVEDDPISLQFSTTLLSGFKLNLDYAQTGQRALSCINSGEYDLILMDIGLPDTNGMFLLNRVTSEDGPNKGTPIIMLTGNKNKKTVQQAIGHGAKGYLIKPLRKESLSKLFVKYDLPLSPKKVMN